MNSPRDEHWQLSPGAIPSTWGTGLESALTSDSSLLRARPVETASIKPFLRIIPGIKHSQLLQRSISQYPLNLKFKGMHSVRVNIDSYVPLQRLSPPVFFLSTNLQPGARFYERQLRQSRKTPEQREVLRYPNFRLNLCDVANRNRKLRYFSTRSCSTVFFLRRNCLS